MSNLDKDYFQQLLSTITQHPDWIFSEKNTKSITSVVEEATNRRSTNEFFIEHTSTDAAFQLVMPNLSRTSLAVQGVMKQPLDGSQNSDPYPDSFGESVMEAYQCVVRDYESKYLHIEPNPITILSINIPINYENNEVINSLDVSSDVSLEIMEVNNSVTEVLSNYTLS